MAPRTILFASDFTGMGGGETSLLNHIDDLDASRFKPLAVLPNDGPLSKILDLRSIPWRMLPFAPIKRMGKFVISFPWSALIGIYGILREHRVGLVIANGFTTMAFAAPIARWLGIPVIWTCHGWWPSGKLTGAFINRFVDKVIAVSNFVKAKLVTEGHVNPEKIALIPLGVDWSEYQDHKARKRIRRELGLGERIPIVGMIGRFQKIKGHHIFVEMAIEVRRHYPEARFIVIGSKVFGSSDEETYFERIQQLIDAHNLRQNILLTGFRSDIPQVLKAMDLFVVPSEKESFGMVIIEAMAAGLPVVCCAKGGPEDIIQDQVNGFLLPGQNPATLAEKVSYLLDHPATATTMGQRASSTVKNYYSRRIVKPMWEDLYSEMVHLNRTRRICD